MEFIERLKKAAAEQNKKIVLPEGDDERVVDAAIKAADEGIARIVILDNEKSDVIASRNINHPSIEVLRYKQSPNFEKYKNELYELRKKKGLTIEQAENLCNDPLYYGAMMVYDGEVDGMVAGANNSTAETLRPALQIVKTAPGINTISAFFLMVVPDCEYGDDGVFIFADSGLVEFPTTDQLVDIAVTSAKTFERITGDEPIVAMLSYSTKGSAKNERLQPILDATAKLKKQYPNLKVDGELQADAALDYSVGSMKAKGSPVAGRANVLIFPDLNSGNIGYKLVQRLAKANAYGPITQGLKRPINDLSRGCNVDDIVGVIAITCL